VEFYIKYFERDNKCMALFVKFPLETNLLLKKEHN